MSTYKTLEKTDIESVFEDLLDKNSQTTSLEVKEELRNKGFWATQAVVGTELRKIADEKECDWNFNGTYRIYYEPGTLMSPTSVQTVTVTSSPPKLPIPNDLRDPITNPVKDDWEVSCIGQDVMYFSGKLRAGQAKSLYVQSTEADFLDVRVLRVQ
jgi:hypothetical protein